MKSYLSWLVALALLIAPLTAFAAISRVTGQDAHTSNATYPATVTYTSTPTAGDLLIITFYSNLGTPVVTSGANTWTQAISTVITGTARFNVWYRVAGASEPTSVTVTDAGAGGFYGDIYEYTGFVGTPTIDQVVSNASGSNTNTLNTGTTGSTLYPDELVFASVGIAGGGSSPSFTNSFTALTSNTRMQDANQIVSAISTYTTTGTWSGSAARAAAGIATFYDATGGGGASCTYSGSGDWNVLGSDHCYVSGNTYVTGACNFIGTGYMDLAGTISCSTIHGGAGFQINGKNGTAILYER